VGETQRQSKKRRIKLCPPEEAGVYLSFFLHPALGTALEPPRASLAHQRDTRDRDIEERRTSQCRTKVKHALQHGS